MAEETDTLDTVKAQVMAKRAEKEGQMYTFQNAWGGISHGSEAPKILSKLLKLRMMVGSLAAKREKDERGNQPQFPVKSSKELMQKLCQAMADEDILAPVIAQDVTQIPDITFMGKNGEQPGTGVHVKDTVRFIADDGSFIDFVGSGHGLDRDDKAGGKASTYAYKDAILKGLGIPEKDLVDTDDEAGQGEERVKRTRAPKAAKVPSVRLDSEAAVVEAAAQATPEPVKDPHAGKTAEDFVALIKAAKDKDELLAAASSAKKNLDNAGQQVAGAAYREMKAKLGVK